MIKQVTVLDPKLIKEFVAKLEHGEYELYDYTIEQEFMGYTSKQVKLQVGKYEVTIKEG